MKLAFGRRTRHLIEGRMDVIRVSMPSNVPNRNRLILRSGGLLDAFNVQPHRGGRPVAVVKIVSVSCAPAWQLVENRDYAGREMAREGGIWPDLEAFIDHVFRLNSPHRIEFELVGRYTADRTVSPINHGETDSQKERVS